MSDRDPDLSRWTDDDAGDGPVPDADAMFAQLQARIEARPATARLSDLSTGVRIALAFGVAALLSLLSGVTSKRAHMLGPAGTGQAVFLFAAVGYAGVLVWTALAALRPLHVPALSPVSLWLRLSLGLALAFVFAGLPAMLGVLPEAAVPQGAFARHASGCLLFGLAMGVPVFALLWLLDRGQRMTPWLSAVAAGASGNLALQVHCAVEGTVHRLVGHATLGVVLVSVTAALIGFGRARGDAKPLN